MAVVEAFKVILGFLRNNSAQENQCDQVRECHEAVEDVGTGPYGAHCEVRANEDSGDVDPAVNQGGLFVLAAHQVLQAFFRIVCPAKNRGEREEHQSDGEEERCNDRSGRNDGKSAGEGFHGDVHAFETELRIPCA